MTSGNIADMYDSGPLKLEALRVGDTVEFVLSGELDLSSVGLLRAEFSRASDAAAGVVVDIRGLTFIDSTGIQALVSAKRTWLQQGQECSVLLDESQVKRTLALAGVADFLGISDGRPPS